MTAATVAGTSGPLVVLDADSTLIREEAIELLAAAAGRYEEVAAVTARAMAGELDFAESLRERVATLAGLPVSMLETVRGQMTPTDGAQELIDTVHAAGGRVGVVSGGFTELLAPLAERLGLDFCRANHLEVIDGRLTGRVLGDIVDAEAKRVALVEWADASRIPLSQTVAVGDGANDLRMLDLAAVGVAFCAKPVVRAAADVVIDTPNLAQVLPILGLRG